MSRPLGFADLSGRRVGIWGVGVEGRAVAARLEGVTDDIVLVDDHPTRDDVRASDDGGLDLLRTCEVVLKSPGIPRRRADVLLLDDVGVTVTSALNCWLADADRDHVIAVTGTKGKSTTTSLITFFLQCLGEDAQSAGNIGRPPYDPAFPATRWIVLEVSSYQAVDLTTSPATVVVTSLGEDHLDWHGTLAQYRADKLSLTRLSDDHDTFVANDMSLHDESHQLGGHVTFVDTDDEGLTNALGLVGEHNVRNVALALAVVGHVTRRPMSIVAKVVREQAQNFEPLPGRLTVLARADGVTYVDDGLATAPLPTIAALDHFADDDVALIAGGFDRGVDYQPLAVALTARTRRTVVVVMDEAGARIADTLHASHAEVLVAASMDAAVRAARTSLPEGGVVLLSPAAPSFGAYANWRERSDDFAHVVRLLVADAANA